MKKRIILFSFLLFSLSLFMNGQNDLNGLGYQLQFFPYNFYEWKEDVNKDFIVDTQDVLRIYESIQAAESNDFGPDVNLDKVVDTQDVLKVYDYIQSESSPTLVGPDETMDVITNAIILLDYYGAVLRFPVCRFSIVAPTDNGLLTYIDPVSMGQQETRIWKFMMNPTPDNGNMFSRIQAVVYKAERQADGTWLPTDSLTTYVGSMTNDRVFNRLQDILENCIVPEGFVQEKHYYKTLSGNYIYVNQDGGDLTISGGFQMDSQKQVKVIKTGNVINGTAYLVDNAVYSSYCSVSDVLSANPEFSEFYNLLQACGAITTIAGRKGLNWSSASKNGNLIYIPENNDESVDYLLNTYNYTIYVPTNEAMHEAYALGLPTVKMLEDAIAIDENENEQVWDSAAHLRKVMLDFVKYHIQEKAVVIDNQYELNRYASMKLNKNYVPFKIQLESYGNELWVQGVCSSKQPINKSQMYNVMVREYWLNNKNVESAALIETSSNAVLHAIDHPLLYNYKADADLTKPENNQFIYVPRKLYYEIDY